MMLKTKNFGEIDIDENKIITFEDGLPGFEQMKKFILKELDQESNFTWLQSVEDGDLSFLMMDVQQIKTDYDPLVQEADIETLGDVDLDNIVYYNIAVVPKDIKEMRVNLKAPVVINTKTKKAKQVVCLNDNYDIRYKIFQENNSL